MVCDNKGEQKEERKEVDAVKLVKEDDGFITMKKDRKQ